VKSVLLKLSLALGLCLGLALPVLAHGVIERAEPPVGGAAASAPERVRLWFSEPVDPGLSRIAVTTGPNGGRVDLGDLHLDGEGALTITLRRGLGNGVYFVQWQVFTPGDGHQTSGAYSFGVGTAAQQATTETTERTALGDLARILTLAGQCLFLGLVTFRWLIRLEDDARFARALYWPTQFIRASLGLGLLAALYSQTRALGLPVWEVLGTQWGAAWMARAAASSVVVVRAASLLSGREARAGLLAGAFLILTVAFTSHSAAQAGLAGGLIDAVHQLSASVWVGGVFGAALALRQGERAFLASFGALAIASVGGLAASGLWLAGAQVSYWPALLFTEYGRVLVVKLGLTAAAFGLGAVNAITETRLRWLPFVETAAGIAVIVCAAILTDLPPAVSQPTDGAPLTLSQTKSDGEWTFQMNISPARIGPSVAEIRIAGPHGQPLDAGQVRLHFVPVEIAGNGALESDLVLSRVSPGFYTAAGTNLTSAGRWQALVSAGGARFMNFDWTVGPDNVVRGPGGALDASVRLVDWLNQYASAAGLAVILLAAASWTSLAWRSLRQTAEPRVRLALWMAPGLLLAGAVWLSIKLLS
jgi:copper transport protein